MSGRRGWALSALLLALGATAVRADAPPPDAPIVRDRLVAWGHRPHFGPRAIDTIVVHSSYDALGPAPYDLDGLLAEYRQYGVAPHFVIDRDGGIWRTVAERDVAWHAGRSRMPDGRAGVNAFSLGVELMTTRTDSVTAAQYEALNALIARLAREHPIRHVVRHRDIAPERKDDPWGCDWRRVAQPGQP